MYIIVIFVTSYLYKNFLTKIPKFLQLRQIPY